MGEYWEFNLSLKGEQAVLLITELSLELPY